MRLTDKTLLHPSFRERLKEVDARLVAESIPLYLFEGPRTPFRQAELYALGRTTPNTKTVTKAPAWRSYHQFGLAADYVFKVNGQWTWDEPKHGMWLRYQQIAHEFGLDVLSFEKPHIQYPWPLNDLTRGIYPLNGDAGWTNWLGGQIEQWGTQVRNGQPGAPPPFDIELRPALEVA